MTKISKKLKLQTLSIIAKICHIKLKTIPWPITFSSNLLSNPKSGFLTPAAQNTQRQKVSEKMQFLSKIAKMRDIKKSKTIPWPIKIFSNLLSNPKVGFLVPGAGKTWIMTINVKK